MPRPVFVVVLLLAAVFTLSVVLKPWASGWAGRPQSDSVLKMLLGDSRQMFANHFFIKADVYFHSGNYPSIFDQSRQLFEEQEKHMAHESAEETGEEHVHLPTFLKAPTDWVDRMGRQFRITDHVHLAGKNAREILPWLRISASLDPHRVDTYTVAAYWLRTKIGRVDEAEAFLREGLRANPNSYEIAFDLGRLYEENRNDSARARNLWKLAFRRWQETEGKSKDPNYVAFDSITVRLGLLEEREGRLAEAIRWLELAKPHSPQPEKLQERIDALRAKLANAPAAP